MISIEFSGDNQDELFKPELKRVLEIIEACSSRFTLPEFLNMKLEVNSSTINKIELVVNFTLYVFSVKNQNSLFSVFELVFSSTETGIKYLLCSHHKPHTLEKPDELEKLILDILDTYDYTGIEESISTQNEIQKSRQSETATVKKGNRNRYRNRNRNRNQGIGKYRLEEITASVNPRIATAKKGKINRYRGTGNYDSEKFAARIRIPEIIPGKEIAQELLESSIVDCQLGDYTIIDSQAIRNLFSYSRAKRNIHPQLLKPYKDTNDVRYNEDLLRGKK